MAIIYSYPDNENLLLTDMLIGTSTIRINGRKKNITKNFTLEALGLFIQDNFPAANVQWGNITGTLSNQTDLQEALDEKQANITLTTIGSSGPATFIADILNIPDYSAGYVVPTLQSVTDTGDTTTTTVYLNGGAISESINEQAIFQPDLISTVNLNSGSGASLDSTGKLALSPDGLVSTLFAADNITQDITLQAPNKTAGSYTLATTDDISPVTGFVPYTGATQDVDLGEFEIKAGQVEFDQTPTGAAGVGVMQWNDSDGTVDLGLKGGNVTLQVGQEQVLRVVNKTATNIDLLEANYQAVRVTGAQGQRLKVDLAQAINDTLSAETIGLVTETINNNQEGIITTSGLVRGINTTGSLQGETWADGDILYLSPTTAGNATKVKPVAPNHLIILGYVIRAHINQGSIFVKVDNGYELDELHNVKITTPANNNVLAYTSATDIWENKTIDTVIGYTPFELPALTSGSVLFSNGTTIAQDNANLFWDDTNNRLGINKNNPTVTIDAVGNEYQFAATSGAINFYNTPGVNQPFNFSNLRQNSDYIFKQNVNGAVNTNVLILKGLSGNVLINTATDAGFKLDVNGTARVSGNLTIDNLNCNAVRGSFFNTFNNGYTVFKSFTASGNAAFYNSVSVGTTATPVASAVLEAVSTTKGFLPPRMTTTQKNAIATPAAGLVVYDTDLNQLCTYDGTWGDSPFYQQSLRGVRYFTDFDSSSSYDNFVSLVSGVAAATGRLNNNVPNQTANQIGIAQYQTGTATTGYAMHITDSSANAQQFQFGGGNWMYESYIEVSTLSDATDRFRFVSGFGNVATSGVETNGAFFTYDEGGVSNGTIASPNWQCVTINNGVRTLTTTSVAVTTTWTKLRIIVNAAATSVTFFINGTLVATHTTNIPTFAAGRRFKVKQMIAKSLGTGNRFVYCDYIFYENNLTTLR
jgi:hypothetical protein